MLDFAGRVPAFVVALMSAAGAASADTIIVPTDQPSIRDAIAAASSGDTIRVWQDLGSSVNGLVDFAGRDIDLVFESVVPFTAGAFTVIDQEETFRVANGVSMQAIASGNMPAPSLEFAGGLIVPDNASAVIEGEDLSFGQGGGTSVVTPQIGDNASLTVRSFANTVDLNLESVQIGDNSTFLIEFVDTLQWQSGQRGDLRLGKNAAFEVIQTGLNIGFLQIENFNSIIADDGSTIRVLSTSGSERLSVGTLQLTNTSVETPWLDVGSGVVTGGDLRVSTLQFGQVQPNTGDPFVFFENVDVTARASIDQRFFSAEAAFYFIDSTLVVLGTEQAPSGREGINVDSTAFLNCEVFTPYFVVQNGSQQGTPAEFSGGTLRSPDIEIDGELLVTANTLFVGDLRLQSQGVLNVQLGTLTLIGDLEQQGGQIIGSFVQNPGGQPLTATNTLAIAGDYTLDSAASVDLGEDAQLIIDGDALFGFTDSLTTDLSGTTITLTADVTAPDSALLEVFAADLGPIDDGFESSPGTAGRFPLKALIIDGDVELVDINDNDTAGQTVGEAIYVESLTVNPGGSLQLNGLKIYTRALSGGEAISGGSVSVVDLPEPCPGDTNADNVVDAIDFFAVIQFFGTGTTLAQGNFPGVDDVNPLTSASDFFHVIQNFGRVCD